MSYLASLPGEQTLRELFPRYQGVAQPLLQLHENLLRGEGALTAAEKELIAAHTSALNACAYCHDIHKTTAEAFGVEPGLLKALTEDPDTAPVDAKTGALLAFTRKVTLAPARITAADADAVYAAGWSEDALFEAVATCALFNFMNRLVDGLGITATPERKKEGGHFLHKQGYAGILRLLESGSGGYFPPPPRVL